MVSHQSLATEPVSIDDKEFLHFLAFSFHSEDKVMDPLSVAQTLSTDKTQDMKEQMEAPMKDSMIEKETINHE